jgi:hypothetical protein
VTPPVETARRVGMGLDDWLDEVITHYAGLDQHARCRVAFVDRLRVSLSNSFRVSRSDRRRRRSQAELRARSCADRSTASKVLPLIDYGLFDPRTLLVERDLNHDHISLMGIEARLTQLPKRKKMICRCALRNGGPVRR